MDDDAVRRGNPSIIPTYCYKSIFNQKIIDDLGQSLNDLLQQIG